MKIYDAVIVFSKGWRQELDPDTTVVIPDVDLELFTEQIALIEQFYIDKILEAGTRDRPATEEQGLAIEAVVNMLEKWVKPVPTNKL